jgi:hypothetical protein
VVMLQNDATGAALAARIASLVKDAPARMRIARRLAGSLGPRRQR